VSLGSFTLKKAEIAASAVFFALAAFVMVEGARLGAGWDERGPEAGFFPFWLAVLMAFGSIAAFIKGVSGRAAPGPFFENRQEVTDLVQVGAPLAAAILVIPWLGVYVATWLYVWLFGWWYGRFRWWTSLAGGAAFATVMYFALTRGMNLPMPMSVFYEKGILPF
jgi:putative tricarboxylic transport membrane protein